MSLPLGKAVKGIETIGRIIVEHIGDLLLLRVKPQGRIEMAERGFTYTSIGQG